MSEVKTEIKKILQCENDSTFIIQPLKINRTKALTFRNAAKSDFLRKKEQRQKLNIISAK